MSAPEQDSTLEQIHSALATVLLTRLQAGDITAAEMRCCIQFLKDNNFNGLPETNADTAEMAQMFQGPFKVADLDEVAQGE